LRTFLLHFAAIGLFLGSTIPLLSEAQKGQPATTAAPQHIASEAVTNPIADSKAVVTIGKARFTVLTPEMIRMEWVDDGKFEDHASFVFVNRHLPVPRFDKQVSGSKLSLRTSALTLAYDGSSAEGKFTPDDLSVELTVDGKQVTWRPGMQDTENLQGTTRTLDGALGGKTAEPMEQGLISRSGWVVVDDSKRPLFDSDNFSFKEGEKSPWPWVMERPTGDRQDWYFFGYGHEYKKALGDFVKVGGRIPLPPRFAFGTWWSRYWDYSDQEIEEIIHGFRQNSTPLDVFVIDMGWHISLEQLKARGYGDKHDQDQSGHYLGWSGYTWNNVLFPYPGDFLDRLHADHLKTSLNLHPASGIQPWEASYPAMAKAMGIDPATKQYVAYDITNKKFAENYFNLVLHPLEKQGIDFWWLDWQQEQNTTMPNVKPTWWINYVHFTDQEREGKRPLLFHRWGGLGNHRYQIGFSGDTVSVWDSLAFQPWFTSTAANVGYAYWSHDIGGHMPGAVEPELFTRWVEFGAFSPILRTHTTKNPESERRIWAYPEPFSSILRSTFQLRYKLQPYIYTEARRTYDTGVAFLRPLYYDWPESDEAYQSKNEYLFGDQMLVDPVVTPSDKQSGLATEKVWLPKGEWIEWPSGKHFTGPTSVDRSFSIDQIPVYVKEGAIVPMQPEMSYTGEKHVDPLIVNVWPLAPGQSTSYSLYEDNGIAEQYQHGVYTHTPIKATQSGDALRVEIGPVEGSFAGMLKSRGYTVQLPADWPPASVTVDGVPLRQAGSIGTGGWSFEGNTLTTMIPVASRSTGSKVVIEVKRAAGLTARRAELDGFNGAMVRLRATYDALNTTPPLAAPPDILIDAMQTGDRLGYHPEDAQKEIAHFRTVMPEAKAAVDKLVQEGNGRLEEFGLRLHREAGNNIDIKAERQKRADALARAAKLVVDAAR
jgi:alpha-glucosidase (family GH31 glycosyl hydrolase)